MPTNILITGATGQLGEEVVKAFINDNKYNIIATNSTSLDITNSNVISSFFTENKIDYIINCAAYTNVDGAENDLINCTRLNIDAVANLAKAAKKQNAKFIHISTDYVYDGYNYRPYSEDDRTNPLSVYGTTKLEGERVLLDILPNSIIIRTSWLYSSHSKNFLKTMLRLAVQSDSLNVVCDQVGTPTNSSDLANAIYHIINSGKWINGIYNYSNEGAISWYDFAKTIMMQADKDIKINPILSKDFPTAAKRPFYSVLDKSKIKNTFGIEIPYWAESLRKCIQQIK